MSAVSLSLGPVVFQDYEISAGIGFGGEQQLAVHQLPGGTRIVDALGRCDAEVTFCGIFAGSDATLRARILDEMRASGASLPLTWDVFFYTVVIRGFHADYNNSFWISYHLSCLVVRDEASALIQAAASAVTTVIADIASGAALSLGTFDLSAAQTALQLPGSMTQGTSSYASARTQLASSFGGLGSAIDQQGGNLDAASATLASGSDPLLGVTAMTNAADSSGQLAALSSARGYVGRALFNLNNAGT